MNPRFAINLVAEEPVVVIDGSHTYCDGGEPACAVSGCSTARKPFVECVTASFLSLCAWPECSCTDICDVMTLIGLPVVIVLLKVWVLVQCFTLRVS